ncbi:zinc ribbon domain-containing protein [Bradyrhizobium sp. Cp5.3]
MSGLLRCGYCGSGMSVHDRDKTEGPGFVAQPCARAAVARIAGSSS